MDGKIQKPVKLFKTFQEKSNLPEKVLTDGRKVTKTRKTFTRKTIWITGPHSTNPKYLKNAKSEHLIG
jgi:hypothetical protein